MTVVPLRNWEATPAPDCIVMQLQRVQQSHDELAHRDILSFSLHKRLKHMILHFYKYAGNIEEAKANQDMTSLKKTLVDAYIISMASANAMNLSLSKAWGISTEIQDLDALAVSFGHRFKGQELFNTAISQFVLIGGKMAKAIESEDHMEDGNPRAAMTDLVPRMAAAVLGILGHLEKGIETAIRERLYLVEQKSIFSRPH